MKKRIIAWALRAVVIWVAGVFTTAYATGYNGDLIIGFSDGVGNDLIYDLGAPSSVTNGRTWNLSSLVSGYTLSSVSWGVVGNSLANLSARTVYTTRSSPPATVNSGLGSQINVSDTAMFQSLPAAGSGQFVIVDLTSQNSWNQQTINATLSTQYINVYGDPNAIGVVSIGFYKATANSSAPALLGSFSLAANGVLKFTSVSTAPPPPRLSITRNGNLSLISFLSANNAAYSLYFTNSTGLTAFLTNWPSQAGTIVGDGTTKTFTNTSPDIIRFYRVSAQ